MCEIWLDQYGIGGCLENGFGDTPEEVAGTIRLAAVGAGGGALSLGGIWQAPYLADQVVSA